MTTAPPGRLAEAGTEPEALIREARRRQRRRYLAAGVALAAVLAAAAGVITAVSSGSHPQRPISRSARTGPARATRPLPGLNLTGAATTVVMWPDGPPDFTNTGGPPAYVNDLTTGHLSQRQVPGIIGCDCQPYLIGSGQQLVYVGSGGTTVIAADLTGKPRVLGTTQFFAPTAVPSHVWLVRYRNGMLGQAPVRVQSVPITGGQPGPVVTLPAGAATLVAGTDAGLLLETRGHGGGLAMWHPGAPPMTLPYSPLWEDGFDATARLIAYGTGCSWHVTAQNAAPSSTGYRACTMLRILNVVTGRLVSFTAPPGTAGWVPNGFDLASAISPDNQRMAAYAAARPPRKGNTRLYAIWLTSPSHQPRAAPSSAAPLFGRTAWSARDSWLLYQGPRMHLWAYQVTTGKTRASSTPCCQYTAMVAVPEHSG